MWNTGCRRGWKSFSRSANSMRSRIFRLYCTISGKVKSCRYGRRIGADREVGLACQYTSVTAHFFKFKKSCIVFQRNFIYEQEKLGTQITLQFFCTWGSEPKCCGSDSAKLVLLVSME
jgi:hypothetical protein